ncbi:MAG TPA: YlxR family protein [Nocardioidaceae bacterium]|nr:YlxR family protein [Nocardioidaceae bacterium]
MGCRERSAKSDLLRLVVRVCGPRRAVVCDPPGTAPGRGAHLHPSTACLDLAERRRALPRALRIEGPLDLSAVRMYVEARTQDLTDVAPAGASTERKRSSRS